MVLLHNKETRFVFAQTHYFDQKIIEVVNELKFFPKEMIEICYFIHQIHLLSNPIKERMNNFEEQILQIIMTAILIIFLSFFLWSSCHFWHLREISVIWPSKGVIHKPRGQNFGYFWLPSTFVVTSTK